MSAHPSYLTIGSRAILACRKTLAAGMSTRFLGSVPIGTGRAPDPDYTISAAIDALPPSVSITASESHDARVRELDADCMDALHATAVAAAWSDGAWDLQVSFLPPLDGPGLGLVTAFRDYGDCDPLLRKMLVQAAEAGDLVYWMWRPMRNGPAVRRKAHAHKDATLDGLGARCGTAPDELAKPIWTWRGARDWTIRLGQWTPEHAPQPPGPRRATGSQRAYIVALRRRFAVGASPLPAALTSSEASAMIDKLLDMAP